MVHSFPRLGLCLTAFSWALWADQVDFFSSLPLWIVAIQDVAALQFWATVKSIAGALDQNDITLFGGRHFILRCDPCHHFVGCVLVAHRCRVDTTANTLNPNLLLYSDFYWNALGVYAEKCIYVNATFGETAEMQQM